MAFESDFALFINDKERTSPSLVDNPKHFTARRAAFFSLFIGIVETRDLSWHLNNQDTKGYRYDGL